MASQRKAKPVKREAYIVATFFSEGPALWAMRFQMNERLYLDGAKALKSFCATTGIDEPESIESFMAGVVARQYPFGESGWIELRRIGIVE